MLSCLTVSFRSVVLDVLTPLSDSRQEPVEKMERRISGVSYMCWMDFHNAMLCCGFLCARLISVYSVSILSLLSLLLSLFRLPRQGLPRPIYTARAITPLPPLRGYHACLYPAYHAIVLSSIPRLSHLRVGFSYFSSHRLIRQYFHNNNTFLPSLAHTARTHSTR